MSDLALHTGTHHPDPGPWRSAGRPRPGSPRGRRSSGRARLVAGASGLTLLVLAAALVPWLGGLDEGLVDYTAIRQAPSAAHPFGTDSVGRDVLLRSFAGLWVSLQVAAACAVLSTVIGTLFGALSGLLGGWYDRLLMRVVDAVNAVPHLLLGIVIVALYRGSVLAVIASIGLTHWTTVARVVRSEILSLRERPFVDAAISGGASRLRVLRRHLLPAVVPQAVLSAVLILPHAVWHETALSFLGLGLPPHLASLGTILGEGRQAVLLGSWWIVVFPSVLLAATTLCVAGIAAWWRDRTLPRRRSEQAL
ncbi:Dipeptide transport system permease protein DppC [Pseudonocardia sp. Ae168_Ps1]|uniref:ABC transporter permease n=1 Tax=unclassified Pseudonocardia TaxID=2619320 RepID=UPI00094AB2E6|nr:MULTISPECIES: ABC transporter permease [unclassified Pseudonocardia]OLL74109.1 Dipeptide transport system permease protein DppC [Pseudonocardia sp. Ae150A_Ps1]OLL80088.1 Dipeptide transport system permease protein DppC [Pseudonocardia sp. Ae168_Ps1]OLL85781.1 Dipeptide transport system permease protein DppC [Pseudonocardia sp. Ae263_Ps1]OLL94188.1 Dipeptide transport system permease protein DppC [Pseudonocardia sp. Ae356_Ps1]